MFVGRFFHHLANPEDNADYENLITPFFDLGMPFTEAEKIIRNVEGTIEVTTEDGRICIRNTTPNFACSIKEENGRLRTVWYDDPLGRDSEDGKARKMGLYMERQKKIGTWVNTIEDGYNLWWHNQIDDLMLVYGLHGDVILIHDYKKYS